VVVRLIRPGRASLRHGVSVGRTPWRMFRALASEMMPWEGVHLVQVDERVAPAGHPDRNFTHLRENLLKYVPLNRDQIHVSFGIAFAALSVASVNPSSLGDPS
jgi:6-phosphogluconolactonase/glucosamine-6-phosphate isomerase/deaminase